MIKYILYFVGYVIAALIYIIATVNILDACGYKGNDDDGGIIVLTFVFTLVFILPIIIGYFVVKKLNYMRTNDDITFIKSWSLSEYIADNNTIMQIGEFQTFWGKRHHKCIFTQTNGKQIFIDFFPSMGELSANQISENKNSLRIGLTVSKKLYLYNGKENVESWDTVNL
nr:MAG TPA: hypothetical protein [Crassvirales sp.]